MQIVECPAGYFGQNCSDRCPWPTYGGWCNQTCACATCDHILGCMTTKGNYKWTKKYVIINF